MIPFSPVRNGSPSLIALMRLKDFEISWAGPDLYTNGFCFASTSGEIVCTDPEGTLLQERPDKLITSGEAINGVAFVDRWMAITTRKEVRVFTFPRRDGEKVRCAEMPIGAHGVVASPSGHFLAPLGRSGILFCKPKDGPEQTMTVSSGPQEIYIYRLIALGTASGGEVIACAARKSGVAAMKFKGEGHDHMLSAFSSDGLDVVDVCSLGVEPSNNGIAAVGKDGTILLFQDVMTDRNPVAVRYPSLQGIPYRLLCTKGYLFLLTSMGLYVIAGLIDRSLIGIGHDAVTPVLFVPMEAVDAYLAGERWVLIVMPDGVLRFDVEFLERHKPAKLAQGELRDLRPTPMNPAWKRQELPRQLRPIMAGAGN
jgi:hypothetical protein